ncbi:MAG: HAMP domain-containing protein [Candidatus Latescibacteria bacterium]|nr:HAMP domain-containing protein [Candidatus Latescibacterota bacterium]
MALGVGALHHLEKGDMQGVTAILEAISQQADVMGAAVFDREGNLLAASRSMAPELKGERQVYTETEGKGYLEEQGERRAYTYIAGIPDASGQVPWSLRLVLYERSMLPYVLQARNHILIAIGVLTSILSVLVIYVSQKQIARPLRALTEGAEALGQGELDRRIEIDAEGEIGTLAEALNRMAVNLETSNRAIIQSEKLAAIGQLAAGIAHEIGTPLNVISGSAEYLLMEAEAGAGQTEELKTIVAEVGHIAGLVKRLMAFAWQEEPRIGPIGMADLVESVLALPRRQMEKQGIQVEVILAPGLPEIQGDRDQLQQVLLNLIMNAWQAMAGGGRLRVIGRHRAESGEREERLGQDRRTPSGWVELVVEDTGTGIPAANLQKIFDPFFTTKEVGAGTGLGLAIAHRIVEAHGGRIRVTSQEGMGSRFAVLLPTDRGGRGND